jgi:hypothetical protein
MRLVHSNSCILFPGPDDNTHYGKRDNAVTGVDQEQL